MARAVFHVTPFGNGWKVAAEKEDLDVVRDNKEDAVAEAIRLAKSGELGQVIIHGKNGQIQEEMTYGDDPRDVPG